MTSTYILTAEMDADSFIWLNALRQNHFPPERNLLPAHLTLFHRLSADQIALLGHLDAPGGPLPIMFDAPLLLGFGLAIRVQSAELARMRSEARRIMGGNLSRQDSQPWRPHVTIQNKAPAETARQLQRTLQLDFKPRLGAITGLLVWEYLGGPWNLVRRMPFARTAPDHAEV